ncbi:hypothetical protein HAX54_022944, partial [Datura stramonium]|nr:hypothetical protein [Datura stramonium]
ETLIVPDLNMSHPESSEHASIEASFRRSSPPPTSSLPNRIHRLAELTQSHESQLQKLAQNLLVLIARTKLRESASLVDLELSALDAAMAALSTARGPINNLFEGLGGEDEPHLGSLDEDDEFCDDCKEFTGLRISNSSNLE